ncbi:VOC family protein [Mangrovimonas sp. TPBH4]|uniref:VOC family protein n=1 Tax=Mangrovimonas sp. TPBH4 TaxID=1645914 RepID=UPI0006B45367|nr:VOC family protein [Mangrovimonas sp. TPBH4]
MKVSQNGIPKLIALLFLFFTFSCDQTEYPTLSSTDSIQYNHGQIVWHDLITPNPKQAMDFYSSLFGWTYKSLGTDDMAYHVIYSGGHAIGGIIPLNVSTHPSGEWLSSVSVTDVDKAVEYNTAKGGKTLFKPSNFKGRGRSALVQDPQGAYIAYVHSETGDPQFQVANNSWLWNELWTNDISGSLGYYKGVAPYAAVENNEEKVPYFILKSGDQKLCGVMKNPVENMRSAWLPYIKVVDVESVTTKATSLGAKIMLEPQDNIRNGTVAIIQDPNGAPFAIQIWNQ